jgi:hypothetical protein
MYAGDEGRSPFLVFRPEDFLPVKATANPIPSGGEAEGFFQGVVPGFSQSEASGQGASMVVHFVDINGKSYEAKTPLIGKGTIPDLNLWYKQTYRRTQNDTNRNETR